MLPLPLPTNPTLQAIPVANSNNIENISFDHRQNTPYNAFSYDPLERLTEAEYRVGVLSEGEVFGMDDLGNCTTVNLRSGADQVYDTDTPNITNRYTAVGGNPLTYDPAAFGSRYVASNTIEEPLLSVIPASSVIPAQAGIQNHHYRHDHLHSPVALMSEAAAITWMDSYNNRYPGNHNRPKTGSEPIQPYRDRPSVFDN